MAYQSILFYKPYNVLSQFTNPDGLDCGTLKDFIQLPELYSVGRLDRDSEGLLLLTNHGALKHRLTDPKFQHPRTYWVQVERVPAEAALAQLRAGVRIQGNYHTLPCEARLIAEPELPPRDPPIRWRKTVPTAWLEMSLTEGKNRQVRRMTAAVGFPTLRLVRAAIALPPPAPSITLHLSAPPPSPNPSPQLTLQGLQPGQWRFLTTAETTQLEQLLHPLGSSGGRSPHPLPKPRRSAQRSARRRSH